MSRAWTVHLLVRTLALRRRLVGARAIAQAACAIFFVMPLVTVGNAWAETDPVIGAAGDIGGSWSDDGATAALLDALDPTVVLPLGDMAYPDGTEAEFTNYYDTTWGRLKNRSRPTPGNHEYHQPGAAPYFAYFGSAAGDPAKGYYAYDLGSWRLYSLNSNCDVVGCREGSEQLAWFREDLAAHPHRCTMVYTHAPRFSSHADPSRRDNHSVSDLYAAFYAASGDVWLSGHQHFYERLAPLDPAAVVDPLRGIRTFIVGTGGAAMYDFGEPRVGSEVRETGTHGILKMTLRANAFDWEFIPVLGRTFTDRGTETCEQDTVAPTAPSDLQATAFGMNRIDLRWKAATDDVGVVGYDVFRDGELIAKGRTSTTFSDRTVGPLTAYQYTVIARDGAGNRSTESNRATAVTDGPTDRRFSPVRDARVEESSPDTNFATASLRVDAGTDPDVESYLGFDVGGLDGPVRRATLRVFATTPTVDGPAVYAADNGWTETGLSWATRPARIGEPLDDAGAVPADSWVDYDVTAAVQGDGEYTFALVGASNDGLDLRPRESALPPQLIVEVEPPVETFSPVRDARAEESWPDMNFPTGSLRVDAGGDPHVESYLTFGVEGLEGSVRSARLRLFATTPTVDGPAVYRADNGWTETGLTWATRPPLIGEPLDDLGAVPDDSWVEYDVTAAVQGQGEYTFALVGASSDGVDFRPRESALSPQLVVTTDRGEFLSPAAAPAP